MGNSETFGQRARSARLAIWREDGTHPSQTEIARKAGKRQQWLDRIERDETRAIPIEDVTALAGALGEDPYYLLTGRAYNVELSETVRYFKNLEDADAIDERGWITVRQAAAVQAEQTRLRRVTQSLSAEEAEWVELLRALSPVQRQMLLAGAGQEQPQPPASETPSPAVPRRNRPARPA